MIFELLIVADSIENNKQSDLSSENLVDSELNRYSDEYDFNLDDLEETETSKIPPVPKIVILENIQISEKNQDLEVKEISSYSSEQENSVVFPISTFKNDDLDKEIESFDVKSNDNFNKSRIAEMLKDHLSNLEPKLSGTSDDIIDLESGITKPKEIMSLMKRFEKHTTKTHVHKNKVHLK